MRPYFLVASNMLSRTRKAPALSSAADYPSREDSWPATDKPHQDHSLGTMTMPTGTLPPDANGEPETGESKPVAALTENAEMLLSSLLTMYKKLPLESRATPKGSWPVGNCGIGDKPPVMMPNA